jgi:hypothetical protein
MGQVIAVNFKNFGLLCIPSSVFEGANSRAGNVQHFTIIFFELLLLLHLLSELLSVSDTIK